jgi:3-hydroxyacyl-[acyl-carrier-protein] dehydratase
MTHEELKSRLPHRDPMLLVGEVTTKEDDENTAVGKTYIRGDEWFLQGHFPGNPIVPGVILCEIMAQSVCALISCDNALPLFSGMKNVKWKKSVKPGDTFVTECSITRRLGNFCFVKGTGYVGEDVALEAEFSFALVPTENTEA